MNGSSRIDDRPSFQFYPKDWLAEPGLRMCSVAARGAWIDLLCCMWAAPVRGVLAYGTAAGTGNGPEEANAKQTPSKRKQSESKTVARIIGTSEADAAALIAELEEHGVVARHDNGCLYNRRMYREWSLSRKRADAGSKGGRASKTEAPRAPACPSPSPSPLKKDNGARAEDDPTGTAPATDMLPNPLACMGNSGVSQEQFDAWVALYRETWKKPGYKAKASALNAMADRAAEYAGRHADPVAHVIRKSRRIYEGGDTWRGQHCDLLTLMAEKAFGDIFEAADDGGVADWNLPADKRMK